MIIELPQVGESVTEGTITQWLKRAGDRVEKYDPLVEVLTDKVSMEVPSPVSGVVTELIAGEGETVPMGAPIAAVRADEEAGAARSPNAGGNGASAPQTPAAPKTQSAQDGANAQDAQSIGRTGVLLKDVAPVGPTGSGALESAAANRAAQDGGALDGVSGAAPDAPAKRRYSPAVMRLADEHGVDLSQLNGSGIGGRITRKDVLAAIDAAPSATAEPSAGAAPRSQTSQPPQPPEPTPAAAPAQQPPGAAPAANADEERVPLTPLRRVIAANMARSATEIPAAWSITEVDATGLVRLRDAAKDDFQRREGVNLTYLHFVVKAVAESLKENPLLNSSWADDAIIVKRRVNIGIAVAAPGGLVVPVVRDADALSVAEIASRVADLTVRARHGTLTLDDIRGGTFTLNNTGALGSMASQPIINHPQAAILTTEAIVKRPVVIGEGIAIRSMMNICLTFDHRVMDGAEASAFTNAVKRRIEAISDDTPIY